MIDKSIIELVGRNKIVVFYSGGLDSTFMLYSIRSSFPYNFIYLFHVSYYFNGVSNSNKKLCYFNSIYYNCRFVNVKLNVGNNCSEKTLRVLRYLNVLLYMRNNNLKFLFVAHNNDDLIETFFLNILRGSGLNGLFSLKKISSIGSFLLFRPLLGYRRSSYIRILSNKLFISYDVSNNEILNNNRNYVRFFLKSFLGIRFFYHKYFNRFLLNISSYRNLFFISGCFVGINDIFFINNSNPFISNKFVNNRFSVSTNSIKLDNINVCTSFLTSFLRFNGLFDLSRSLVIEIIRKLLSDSFFFIRRKSFYLYGSPKGLYISKMKIFLKKYGGTSLKNLKRITNISYRTLNIVNSGYKVVIVVSAPAKLTNTLINIFSMISNDLYSLDLSLSSGEILSAGLLSGAIRMLGIKCIYLLASQIGMLTDINYSKASVIKIDSYKILSYLSVYDVIVIPGFQGVTSKGFVTTLGRGGSDNSAIELCHSLGLGNCFIYTDVKGVYSMDPNAYDNPVFIKKISAFEMLEMSSLGSKVMQLNSMVNAIKYSLNVTILSSFSKFKSIDFELSRGTKILIDYDMFSGNIKSIHSSDDVFCKFICKKPVEMSSIIDGLSNLNILIDCFNGYLYRGYYVYFFTVSFKVYMENLSFFKSNLIRVRSGFCKISLVGIGLKNNNNNIAAILSLITSNSLFFYATSSSEVRLSFLFKKKDEFLAINLFKSYFNI